MSAASFQDFISSQVESIIQSILRDDGSDDGNSLSVLFGIKNIRNEVDTGTWLGICMLQAGIRNVEGDVELGDIGLMDMSRLSVPTQVGALPRNYTPRHQPGNGFDDAIQSSYT